jgi:heptosyltransferase-1
LLFPSGNQEEFNRASEICLNSRNAIPLNFMPLDQVAFILDKAQFAICSDTGLAHLSAVTSTPSLTLYGPTNTSLIGTKGIDQYHLTGDEGDINKISVEEVLSKVSELNFLN